MKKKIAVLHAQCAFMRGGAEALVENLTTQLRKRGFDTELVSLPFKWYPHNTLLDCYYMWRMADLTESNGNKIDLAIATKVPTYMLPHPNKVLWLMHQHRVAYDLADSIPAGGFNTIPDGREMIQHLRDMDGKAIGNIKHRYSISQTVSNRLQLYNGISSNPLYHPPTLEGQYFSDKYNDYVLSVGRLDPNKRVDLMIRALPFCDKKITAVIAGKGNEMENLQKLAENLGVADRVKFLGFVPDKDLPALYANALAVCFPPIDEDYGYITLEAFLSSRPLVTCVDSGGVLEFAKHNENAFVCAPNAPQEMGEAFQQLYLNKNRAAEMGRQGYLKVKDISWDHVIDELTRTIR